ncbi:hypothetical protein D3C81_1277040 [compost metagenome]
MFIWLRLPAVSNEPLPTVNTGSPPWKALRQSSMIRGSGIRSLHSSRPASGTPFMAARLAARMMS